MQAVFPAFESLSTRLIAAFMPLVKGSQAEVMAVTADLDLSLSQGRILLELEKADEALAVNDIAARISLSIAATGRAIDALHRSGLLTRREDGTDRRIKRISLTQSGASIIAEIVQVKRQVTDRFVAALTDDERIALEGAVATIAALTAKHFQAAKGSLASVTPAQEP